MDHGSLNSTHIRQVFWAISCGIGVGHFGTSEDYVADYVEGMCIFNRRGLLVDTLQ